MTNSALMTQTPAPIRLPQQWEWDIMKNYAQAAVKSGLIGTVKHPVTVDQALFVVLKGYELNVTPIEALSNIHLVNGKPGLSVQLMIALANRSGALSRLDMPDASKAATEQKATVTAVRRDRPESPVTMTFSMQDAAAANLLGNPIWKSYPGQMLVNRAMSMALRRAIPEALSGLYLAEELGDAAEEQVAMGLNEGPQAPALPATTEETPVEAKPTPPTWWIPATRRYAEGHDKAAALVFADKAKALLNAGTLAHDTPVETAFMVVVNALEDDANEGVIVEGDGLPKAWASIVKDVARHMEGDIEAAKAFILDQIERGTVIVGDGGFKAKAKLIGLLTKAAIETGELEPLPIVDPLDAILGTDEPAAIAEAPSEDPFADLRTK